MIIALLFFPLAVFETEWIFRTVGLDWRGGVFTLTGGVYVISFVLAFLSFDKLKSPFSKRVSDIGRASFGIYLLHTSVLEIAARATQKYYPQLLAYPVGFQLVLAIFGVGVPLVVMAIIARSPAQRQYRYLFG